MIVETGTAPQTKKVELLLQKGHCSAVLQFWSSSSKSEPGSEYHKLWKNPQCADQSPLGSDRITG